MSEQQALAGQVAWVTGGGSGIGLAGAIELAKAGCRVVVSGRDAAKLDAAIADAEARGAPPGSIGAAPLDVADAGAVKRVATAIQDRYGQVDILVNSAGINFAKRFWGETDSATFGEVVADQPERRHRLHAGGAEGDAAAAPRHGHQRRLVRRLVPRLSHRPGLHREQGRHDRAQPLVQHRGVRQRPARDGALPGRGGDADPEEAPGRAERRGKGAHAPGRRPRPDDPLHRRDAAARVHQRARRSRRSGTASTSAART